MLHKVGVLYSDYMKNNTLILILVILSLTLLAILIKQQWMLSQQSAQVATKNEAAIKAPLEKDDQNLNKTKTLLLNSRTNTVSLRPLDMLVLSLEQNLTR
jgi:flagellar basal body-associated protein FliL